MVRRFPSGRGRSPTELLSATEHVPVVSSTVAQFLSNYYLTPRALKTERPKYSDGGSRPGGCFVREMGDFKSLKVWRKAHALALNVHRAATRIRGRDQIALRSQMLRAAMSIPANIVEGTGKGSAAEFCRFLNIAVGSACELEYHLMMARDLRVLSTTEFDSLHSDAIEIRKMLCGLVSKLKSAPSRPRTGASASSC